MRKPYLSPHALLKSLLCGAALCAATFAHAQQVLTDFASQTPLTLTGNGPWYRLELPLAVQLNARQANLGDLRVFNADGQPLAYALAQNPAQRAEEQPATAVKMFPLYNSSDRRDAAPMVRVQRSANGTVVEVLPQTDIEAGDEVLRGWLLDASELKAPLERLTLDWSTEHEGFQHFTIEASDDLQHWQSWGSGQVARLSFSDELVEQREVTLPGLKARYLRLLWRSPQTVPTLTSALVLGTSNDAPPAPLSWSPALTGTLDKPGEYLWQLPTALPVARLRFDIAQANSLAPGTLYGRLDSTKPWQAIGSGLLYRLSENGQDVSQDEIQLAGYPVRQLKLEVDERGGGLGPDAPKLHFAVAPTQVVFLARGNAPFTLAIGNPMAVAADLPISTLIPDYSAQKLASLSSAQPTKAPVVDLTPLAPAPTPIDWKRIGLWALLLLGVAFLGWMALSTLRAAPPKS
jgi:hypothetical protein